MENTQETNISQSASSNTPSLGGKVAITIILTILLLGAFYYFFAIKKTAPEAPLVPQQETSESLSTELDSTTNVDLDADLKAIEESFN